MKSIRTEIIINAKPSIVWTNLMDFANYPNWNPFIHITGQAQLGSQLENTIFLEGQKPQVFRPTVLEIERHKVFRWEGHLFIKGLFDGEHYFRLEAIEGGKTRFIHGENFRGLLSTMIYKMIGEKTKEGFEKMNLGLKQQCEQLEIGE